MGALFDNNNQEVCHHLQLLASLQRTRGTTLLDVTLTVLRDMETLQHADRCLK